MRYQSWGYKLSPQEAATAWVPSPVGAAVKAGASQLVYFKREKRWKRAKTRWVYGWDPNAKRWTAVNNGGNGRWFRSKRDLLAYQDRMVREWHWEPQPAAL